MKNKYLILIFSLVALVCIAATLLIYRSNGRVVGIYHHGNEIYVIDLDDVSEPYDITVSGESYTNVIHVSSGCIEVKSASCPDNTCVKHGPLESGMPIICLPNELVIKWISDKEYDAWLGAG